MSGKRERLKEALKRLHEAKPEELERVKKEIEAYFKDTEPKELAMAEMERTTYFTPCL